MLAKGRWIGSNEIMALRLGLFTLLVVMGSGACGSSSTDDTTGVRVWFEAEPTLTTRAASLRVRITDTEGAVRDDAVGLAARRLPLAIDLRPRGGDPARRFSVEASLLDGSDAEIARQRVVGGYIAGEVREIRVFFRDDCESVLCADPLTCVAGACADAACYGTGTTPAPCTSAPDAGADAGGCDPAEPPVCDATTLTLCEDGALREVACPLGCATDEACTLPIPSNTPDASLDESVAELRVPRGESWVIDTGDGSIDAWVGVVEGEPSRSIRTPVMGDDGAGLVFRLAPTPLAPGTTGSYGVLSVGRLVVEEGATLQGVGPHPLIVLVATEAVIDGTLSVAASRLAELAPGAGGFPGGVGAGGDGPGGGGHGEVGDPYNRSGGGGGGFGSSGADGGDGRNPDPMTPSTGGAGGTTYGEETLSPLVGGSGGGSAGGSGSSAGEGGHGGGALQVTAGWLIAVRGPSSGASGIVDASGGGGYGRRLGGGGGGSGGAILLEAPIVRIDGIVGSNGGAGAPGDVNVSDGVCDGDYGLAANGRAERVPAPGVELMAGCTGDGGDGSDLDGVAGEGGRGRDGGGGGGGAGRIRVNTAAGTETYDMGVVPGVLTTVGTISSP